MNEDLVKSATHAAAVIGAIYQWADAVKEAGGPASLPGIAKAKAMLDSLEKNRARTEQLVMEPLRRALEEAA